MRQVCERTFDDIAQEASKLWNEHCGRINVTGGTREQKEIFYSSLYHSLIKPANWCGESPFWKKDAFFVDYATMWDQYKTQLPLIVTLYPEQGRDVINALLSLAEHIGGFPNGFVLNADLEQFENQARCLAHDDRLVAMLEVPLRCAS